MLLCFDEKKVRIGHALVDLRATRQAHQHAVTRSVGLVRTSALRTHCSGIFGAKAMVEQGIEFGLTEIISVGLSHFHQQVS